MNAVSQRFENELAGLINSHGRSLNDNQVITVLERAIDEAYAACGEPEPSKLRVAMIAALKVAQHALTVSNGLRATDLTEAQVQKFLQDGKSRADLEFDIDNTADLATIDAAIAQAEAVAK